MNKQITGAMTKRAGALSAVMASVALALAGCGETGDTDPTPVQTFKITPAANATAAPSAEPPATQTASSPSDGPIAIAAVGSTFDVEEVEAAAGPITIEFDNRDGGVIHNIHVFRGDDNDGESVAQTELEVGPNKQTLTFDAEPGNYFYQCDAHPTTMEGSIKAN